MRSGTREAAAIRSAIAVFRGVRRLAALAVRMRPMRMPRRRGAARVAFRSVASGRGTIESKRVRGFETGDRLDGDVLLQQTANIAQPALLFVRDQRNRKSFGARATGATDAVYVILGNHR